MFIGIATFAPCVIIYSFVIADTLIFTFLGRSCRFGGGEHRAQTPDLTAIGGRVERTVCADGKADISIDEGNIHQRFLILCC